MNTKTKLIIVGMALAFCSCGPVDFVGFAKTPYGDVTYKTPVVMPEK